MIGLTPKIQKAIIRATQLHFNQKRKAGGLPYITHPYSVAFILTNYTDNEDVITAAFLHDVLEDIDPAVYGEKEMKEEFGERIFNIVKGVTEEKVNSTAEHLKTTWELRKHNYIEKLKVDDEESLLVSCADKIHNLQSLIEAHNKTGKEIWNEFNAPPNTMITSMWFYGEVLKILKERLHNDIVKQLEEIYDTAVKKFHLDTA